MTGVLTIRGTLDIQTCIGKTKWRPIRGMLHEDRGLESCIHKTRNTYSYQKLGERHGIAVSQAPPGAVCPANILILNFQAPELQNNRFFCVLGPNVNINFFFSRGHSFSSSLSQYAKYLCHKNHLTSLMSTFITWLNMILEKELCLPGSCLSSITF